MKKSIKRLPKRTQEELNALLELIRQYVDYAHMVILYGSYARGNYVLWDSKVEFGVKTSYQSDYDILIIVSTSNLKSIQQRLERVAAKYHKLFENRRHASPQFVIENINKVNRKLEVSQYFFTDIAKYGIMLHNDEKYLLTKPRELKYEEIRDIAQKEFDVCHPYGCNFLTTSYFNLEHNMLKECAFILHQACEKFYNSILLVFTNYQPKNHKINELAGMVKRFSREVVTVFPQNTDFEKECFDLLCRAYIEARYDMDFQVTREQLKYIQTRLEVLKDISYRVCTEKIDSYQNLIK